MRSFRELRRFLNFNSEKGDVVARVWPVDRTGVAPVEYRAGRGGLLAGRHFPGLVKAGDFMAVVATPET